MRNSVANLEWCTLELAQYSRELSVLRHCRCGLSERLVTVSARVALVRKSPRDYEYMYMYQYIK